MKPIVEFQKINKFYGSAQACKDITFTIQDQTIHALVGENGAGKSTLMKIFAGLERADSGQIFLKGSAYKPESAKDAFKYRIGFVQQHFLLADNRNVIDHLILNWPYKSLLRPASTNELLKKVELFSAKFNWHINLKTKIRDLSVGEQQRIEIIKALLTDPEIIIFDEPTAVLAPGEILDFLKFLKDLKAEGKTVILISHKLNEIKNVADAVTVLRHGQSILTRDVSEMSVADMAESMIGQKLGSLVTNANIKKENRELFKIGDIGLIVEKNEILGVAGIEGHGQSQLIEKVLATVQKNKISYGDIAEDRIKFNLFPGLNLVEHMTLRHPKHLTKHGFIQQAKAVATTRDLVKAWDVRPHDHLIAVDKLSGGNQQKFVVGRELFHDPDFILAAHPTRGVDLGAQQMIHSALVARKDAGKSVMLVSSDLDEILNLSDVFIILNKNQIYGPFFKKQLSEIEIGQFMTDSHPEQKNFRLGSVGTGTLT
ncbi:MAG: ATP-binding cassette domain-containing protein [Bdellovibrio sp.]|nr:ATP-binding cassette domain-containing protein [Bdellovibrio sp.]